MMKQRITSIIISIGLFLCVVDVRASELFTNEITSQYTFGPYTHTAVDHHIKLINNQDQYYPTSYGLALTSPTIIDAIVQQDGQELAYTYDDQYIEVTLPQTDEYQAEVEFDLRYKVEGIVFKNGLLHEVGIPLISPNSEINYIQQTIKVFAPLNWGEVQTTSFRPTHEYLEEEFRVLEFSIQEEPPPELRVVYGDYQLYDVRLIYHLTNDTNQQNEYVITFPPNLLPYQTVYVNSITPVPDQIEIDQDGNVIGVYELVANDAKDIEFKGQIMVDLQQDPTITPAEIEDVPYLIPDQYWETNAPEIIELANTLESAQEVYNWVVNQLTYNEERVKDPEIARFGALQALQKPDQAVCMEFTDLTITLLRAIGIPAREVDGYAFVPVADEVTQSGPVLRDSLHAWVQYYDPEQGWKNIDPTWGSTTKRDYFNHFDNNHLIFAYKGVHSTYPHPAGSYKLIGQKSQDIYVDLADSSDVVGADLDDWLAQYAYDQLPWYQKLWQWIRELFS